MVLAMATKEPTKKKYPFNTACKFAGDIYGSILQRDSDKAGFDWCVDSLTNGTVSVRDIVKELCTSDEFREKYLMNDSPNEMARKFRQRFLGEAKPKPEDIKSTAISFLEHDWRKAMRDLLDSPGYTAKYGDDKVPR